MNDSAFSLNYQYVDGNSEYYIYKHESKNRIFPFCVAVSVIEGEYFVDFEDGKTVCVKPGEIIFVQSFIKHTVRMKEKGKLTHAHFLCSYVTIDIFALANADYFVIASKEIHNLLNHLVCSPYGNKIAQKLHTDKLLSELFLILFEKKVLIPQKLVIEPWLNGVLQYIHSNFLSGITVDEVIAVSGCSKTVFYQLFKSRMKLSPREYIESERFKVASMLLLEGKKVKEVAEAIGFNDVSYFNKVFKRKYGITPIEQKQKMNYSKG